MSEVKQKRVESLILKEIAGLLHQGKIKDPRVESLATVTAVKASRDLKYAKVYVSHYGSADARRECVAALNHAAGYIQKELGTGLRLRFVPRLTFIEDGSVEQAFRITQKLKELSSE